MRAVVFSFAIAASLFAEEAPRFRTDANPDPALPWYRLVEGQFPPANSAHAISGELILSDHAERRFRFRVDRDDSQQVSHFDLPLEAAMLPYGSIWYHGGPAALQDIPIGTHLHGLFYLRDPGDRSPPPDGTHGRHFAGWEFKRCLRLEDDFSFHARQQQAWRIEGADLAEKNSPPRFWRPSSRARAGRPARPRPST